MDLKLTGKTALITGASKGIGLACAERFAREGCHLRLVARTEADLQAAQAKIASFSDVKVQIFPVDLSVCEAVKHLMDQNRDLDILVNNAGAIPAGHLHEIDENEWRQAWDLKVFGYINMCREALTHMKERGSGTIVNIIGAGGEKPTAGYIVGGAGNAALMALTRGLGATSLHHNIRVVALNPGLIHTDRLETLMRRAARSRFGDEGRWRELLDPRNPPGRPEHIADMAAFLASDLSSFTTGTVVTVDGGSSAR